MKVCFLRKNILHSNCVLPVQSDMKQQCWRVKSCLKREILPLHLDMLTCNPKIGAHFSHIFMWGHFLLPLCLTGLITCCPPPLNNTRISLLGLQFILLATLVVMVKYGKISFSEHLHYISVLELDMADSVAFWVSYE